MVAGDGSSYRVYDQRLLGFVWIQMLIDESAKLQHQLIQTALLMGRAKL